MLSRDLRLLTSSIQPLLRRGIRVHTESIDLLYQKHQTERRFGCIVSKKVEKLATGRNRTKRLIYAALQTFMPKITTGIHGIFIVRKKVSSSQEDVNALVGLVLEKSGGILSS